MGLASPNFNVDSSGPVLEWTEDQASTDGKSDFFLYFLMAKFPGKSVIIDSWRNGGSGENLSVYSIRILSSVFYCISSRLRNNGTYTELPLFGTSDLYSPRYRSTAARIDQPYILCCYTSTLFPSHVRSHTLRSLGCEHTDVVFNITHTVADGISDGNADELFRIDFTHLSYLLSIF